MESGLAGLVSGCRKTDEETEPVRRLQADSGGAELSAKPESDAKPAAD